ncbi:hypothetical protein XENORESO_008301, partial [Xenotaenia resolanae]
MSSEGGKDSEDPDLDSLCAMFRARVHNWLKVLHCSFPAKSLLHLPGTCKPKEGTKLFSGSPAYKTPVCPPSNFTYTSRKETPRSNHHLTTTSPVKHSLHGLTHLPLKTPHLRKSKIHLLTFLVAHDLQQPVFTCFSSVLRPAEPGFPYDLFAFFCLSINQFKLNS